MMKKYLSFFISALFFASLSWGAVAQAADCATIGQRVASEQGGQLTKTTQMSQNGRDVCVVVVIVPGKNGEKPRRVERAVPLS